MTSPQDKLWAAIDGSADPETALPLLQEALTEGVQLSVMRSNDFLTPLRSMLQECCKSKAPMAKALVLAGCNPLEGAFEDAINEEEYVICAAMVEACLERNYTSKKGAGLLAHLIQECPSVSPLGDVVKYALQLGAYTPAPQGTTWLHVLLENPAMLRPADDSSDGHVGWEICEALLESGVDPSQVNAAGVAASELLSARLREGCQLPENADVLHRILGGHLENSTPKVNRSGRSLRI